MLPLALGATGDVVFDLHRRLARAGYETSGDHHCFGSSTEAALRQFQSDRGLVVDGVCGPQSWSALVEAAYKLGDRLLYYRSPTMRGDDVGDLQRRLSRLGFYAEWIDGIFGPATEKAVVQFQVNIGLPDDGVVGRRTLTALNRVARRTAGQRTVAEVRELERLRRQPGRVEGLRVVIGDTCELPAVAQSIARRLRHAGAEVLSFSNPNLSHQARTANIWQGEVYLGVALNTHNFGVSYFSTAGFESWGGRELARHCSRELTAILPGPIQVSGMRLPILRETRMPAVWCRIGPGAEVVTSSAQIAAGLAGAVTRWCVQPVTQVHTNSLG